MAAEDKKRKEVLSRIAADLFVKAKGGEELSSRIHRLRDEIIKTIDNEDTIFGKFRGLVESFREIIPDEKQRYNAAVKALSATSKLSRQEIVKAINNQLEELKMLEKGLMPALPGWRDEFKGMEDRSRELSNEISQLREKIGQLEREEKAILNVMAARTKEMELVEKAVGELFAGIGAEIAYIKDTIEELTAEGPASQPVPVKDLIDIGFEEKGGDEQKIETFESSAPQDTEWQKKCPMCGGRMNFYLKEKLWMCYTCAYEESKEGEVQDKSEHNHTNAPDPAPASEPILDPPSLLTSPLASLPSNEFQISKKQSPSSDNQPPRKKTCPACRKKMDWHEIEKTWRCPFCQYERRVF